MRGGRAVAGLRRLRPAVREIGGAITIALPLLAFAASAWGQEPGSARPAVEGGPGAAEADTTAVVIVELASEAGDPPERPTVQAHRLFLADDPDADGADGSPVTELRRVQVGRFAAEGVRPGVYEVRVAAEGHAPARRDVRLAPGDTALVSIRLVRRPLPLPEIVARATREAEPGWLGHGVERARFADRPLAAPTLAEWLEGLAGVQVRGSRGAQRVSVRGSRPEDVLVLLDGLPLNDPLGGAADLGGISTATLESATLIRGAVPGYGSGAQAGVLLLRSREPDGAAAAAAAELGSFGGTAADARASASTGAGELAATVRWEEGENDFSFDNRALPGDPREVRRNADFRSTRASLTARAAAVPLSIRLRAEEAERGAPGRMGTTLFDRARWEEDAVQAALELGQPAGAGIRMGVRAHRFRYRDPRAGDDERQRTRDARLALGGPLGDLLDLSAHLEMEEVEGDRLSRAVSRITGGVTGGGRLSLPGAEARASVTVDAGAGGTAMSPALAVRARPAAGWSVVARAAQARRLPTFGDLYLSSEHRIRPNPALRAERVTLDAELATEWSDGRGLDVRAGAFHRLTEHPIVWLASATAVWSPRNLDRLLATGVELDLTWRPAEGWRLHGTGTWTRSRVGFGTNRNPLPYAPALSGALSVEWGDAARALRADLRSTGARTTSLAATHRLPGFVLVDLAARQRFRLGDVPLVVDLRLRNATDAAYEVVSLFPEPGRSVELRLELGPLPAASRHRAAGERASDG